MRSDAEFGIAGGKFRRRFHLVNLTGSSLVIFGCGYLGREIAVRAMQAGATVTALTRNQGKATALADAGVTTVVAELASDAWHGTIARADHAVNCVSAGGGADGYRRSYVDGMRSIEVWLRRIGGVPGAFVYTSSTSVYPQNDGTWVTEESATEAISENTAALIDAENLVLKMPVQLAGARFVLRLAGIYGPGRHSVLDALQRGVTALAAGNHHLNLIHRDDAAAAVLSCLVTRLDAANAGIFNISDGTPSPREEVIRWLALRSGCAEPVFDPNVACGRRVPDRRISSSRARTVLGWQPEYRTFQTGYASVIDK